MEFEGKQRQSRQKNRPKSRVTLRLQSRIALPGTGFSIFSLRGGASYLLADTSETGGGYILNWELGEMMPYTTPFGFQLFNHNDEVVVFLGGNDKLYKCSLDSLHVADSIATLGRFKSPVGVKLLEMAVSKSTAYVIHGAGVDPVYTAVTMFDLGTGQSWESKRCSQREYSLVSFFVDGRLHWSSGAPQGPHICDANIEIFRLDGNKVNRVADLLLQNPVISTPLVHGHSLYYIGLDKGVMVDLRKPTAQVLPTKTNNLTSFVMMPDNVICAWRFSAPNFDVLEVQ